MNKSVTRLSGHFILAQLYGQSYGGLCKYAVFIVAASRVNLLNHGI